MSEQAIEWHRVAKAGEIDEDEPKSVEIGRRLIGVYNVEGQFYAIDDICTHEFAILTEGYVDSDVIECPLHQAQFDIRTGKVLEPPAEEDLRTYPVRLDGDDIYVGVPKE